jgi:hypothetical protein
MSAAITAFGASDMVLPIPPLHRFDGESGAARDERMFCFLIGVCRRLGARSGKNHFTYSECCLLSPVGVFCGLIYASHTLSPSHELRCQRWSYVRAEQKGAVAKWMCGDRLASTGDACIRSLVAVRAFVWPKLWCCVSVLGARARVPPNVRWQ